MPTDISEQGLQKEILDLEAALMDERAAIRSLVPGTPEHTAKLQAIKNCLTKLAVLRSALHFFKPRDVLQLEVDTTRVLVDDLTAKFQRASGRTKEQLGAQLRLAVRTLNELVAALKLKDIQAQNGGNLPKDLPETALAPLTFDEPVALPAKMNPDSDSWYKHPLVLVGALGATALFLRRY